jgi:hypothetical protein
MPTPVGPAPRDPNDPDLWEECYDDGDRSDDAVPPARFGWPVRVLAILVILTLAVLVVMAG